MDILSATPMKAFWYGVLSAISLPIGAALGIWLAPPALWVSGIMAFGAGSLLAALTLELVTPAFAHAGFYPLAAGAVVGGLLFVGFNRLINERGGFLRKRATTIRHLVRGRKERMRSRIRHLAQVDILQGVDFEDLEDLMGYMVRRYFREGAVIYREGGVADSFFLIDSGRVQATRSGQRPRPYVEGESFGTRSFIDPAKGRRATMTAMTDVKAWEILREDFDRLVERYPTVQQCLLDLNQRRDAECEQRREQKAKEEEIRQAIEDLELPVDIREVDVHEAHHMAHATGGAALAIWLGIFLDGIPESAVIGASMIHSEVSWALIIGLFLANLPESMSSAVGMREQKASVAKIMWMWTSLTILTGLGALLGNIFLQGAGHATFAVFEGVAAGAMLVMVAETMLPEAFHQGGSITGLCALAGFLAALFVKSLS